MALCLHCNNLCRLTDGKEIYPHRSDLYLNKIWKCDPCSATVGCHPGGTKPLGFAANKETRNARMQLHNKMLDPLWKGTKQRKINRSLVYKFLSHEMKLDPEDTHTGMFDVEDCRRAWKVLSGVTMNDIRGFDFSGAT